MPEQPPLSLESSEVHNNLRQIAQLLRQPHQLGPEAQRALAEVVGELEHALETGVVPAEEMAHLRDSTGHVVQALQRHYDAGLLASARERLEQSLASAEARAPFTVGVVRRLLDALANVGI